MVKAGKSVVLEQVTRVGGSDMPLVGQQIGTTRDFRFTLRAPTNAELDALEKELLAQLKAVAKSLSK